MVSVETIVVSSLNDRLDRTTIGTTTAVVQRSLSMPENNNHNNNNTSSLRQSRSEDLYQKPTKHRLDQYGFIVNLDQHGNLIPSEEEDKEEKQIRQTEQVEEHLQQPQSLSHSEQTAQTQRRIQKWKIMLDKQSSEDGDWHQQQESSSDHHLQRRFKKSDIVLKRRLRKGVPMDVRAPVWTRLCHVAKSIREHPPGTYRRLVEIAIHTGIQPIVEGSNNHLQNQKTNNNNSNTPIHNPNNNHRNQKRRSFSARKSRDTSSQQQQKDNIPMVANSLHHTKSFRNVQETIERDIHRTFPRHTLFYSRDEDDDEDDDNNNENKHHEKNQRNENHENTEENGTEVHEYQYDEDKPFLEQTTLSFCGSLQANNNNYDNYNKNHGKDNDNINNKTNPNGSNSNTAAATTWTHHTYYRMQSGNANADDAPSPKIMLHSGSGQAKLRRLLRAYSAYDHQIGYCQGMNFIAGMFLTIVQDEEQAFWMLVSVMNDPPCQMRSLFEEGMTGTHKVLFVAERLIHQFLPRLAKHFDMEGIHVTMFATQWLLTIFTSSFRFDLVTRVWDCFLYEGWKITYRVMLSLLQHSQTKLLTMSFEEILSYFRELPEKIEAGNEIVDESIKIPLLTSHIQKYEKEWQSKQQQEQLI